MDSTRKRLTQTHTKSTPTTDVHTLHTVHRIQTSTLTLTVYLVQFHQEPVPSDAPSLPAALSTPPSKRVRPRRKRTQALILPSPRHAHGHTHTHTLVHARTHTKTLSLDASFVCQHRSLSTLSPRCWLISPAHVLLLISHKTEWVRRVCGVSACFRACMRVCVCCWYPSVRTHVHPVLCWCLCCVVCVCRDENRNTIQVCW